MAAGALLRVSAIEFDIRPSPLQTRRS